MKFFKLIKSKYIKQYNFLQTVKLSTNWITGKLFALLNENDLGIAQSPISAENLSKLINLIKDGTISGKIAKTVFELMANGDKDPQKIVEEKVKEDPVLKKKVLFIKNIISKIDNKFVF